MFVSRAHVLNAGGSLRASYQCRIRGIRHCWRGACNLRTRGQCSKTDCTPMREMRRHVHESPLPDRRVNSVHCVRETRVIERPHDCRHEATILGRQSGQSRRVVPPCPKSRTPSRSIKPSAWTTPSKPRSPLRQLSSAPPAIGTMVWPTGQAKYEGSGRTIADVFVVHSNLSAIVQHYVSPRGLEQVCAARRAMGLRLEPRERFRVRLATLQI